MRNTFFTSVLITFACLAGCQTTLPLMTFDQMRVAVQGRWEVTSMLDVNFPVDFTLPTGQPFAQTPPYFNIEGHNFSGFDGCNSFGAGKITQVNNEITFDKGQATLRGCLALDPGERTADFIFNEAMTQNPKLVKLSKGRYDIVFDKTPQLREWRIADDGQIEILKDGVVMLRAKRKSADSN